MAKSKEFSYEVNTVIGKLGEESKKELRVVAWNGNPAKIDVRDWWTDKDGNEKCGKGVSLTSDEAKALVDLLTEYLDDEDDDI